MITITPLALNGNDERGYTAEYEHTHAGKELILFRKAGTVSGRHYHKGISKAKDPEILILLNGTCRLNWKHIDDAELQTQLIEGPTKLTIPKLIWHEVIVETDCVFVECNSIEEHVVDTFRLD